MASPIDQSQYYVGLNGIKELKTYMDDNGFLPANLIYYRLKTNGSLTKKGSVNGLKLDTDGLANNLFFKTDDGKMMQTTLDDSNNTDKIYISRPAAAKVAAAKEPAAKVAAAAKESSNSNSNSTEENWLEFIQKPENKDEQYLYTDPNSGQTLNLGKFLNIERKSPTFNQSSAGDQETLQSPQLYVFENRKIPYKELDTLVLAHQSYLNQVSTTPKPQFLKNIDELLAQGNENVATIRNNSKIRSKKNELDTIYRHVEINEEFEKGKKYVILDENNNEKTITCSSSVTQSNSSSSSGGDYTVCVDENGLQHDSYDGIWDPEPKALGTGTKASALGTGTKASASPTLVASMTPASSSTLVASMTPASSNWRTTLTGEDLLNAARQYLDDVYVKKTKTDKFKSGKYYVLDKTSPRGYIKTVCTNIGSIGKTVDTCYYNDSKGNQQETQEAWLDKKNNFIKPASMSQYAKYNNTEPGLQNGGRKTNKKRTKKQKTIRRKTNKKRNKKQQTIRRNTNRRKTIKNK
jgi:hypothetical protein